MEKVLITGAGGFVGSNLTNRCLAQGYEVHVILCKSTHTWRINEKLDHIYCHYTPLEEVAKLDELIGKIKPDIIFHLAAYATYPFQKDIVKTIDSNVLCTVNLLNACVKHGFKSFINTGSSSEYGKKDVAMAEYDLLSPNSLYGVTKAAGTMYCSHIGWENRLPVATLRLFSVYGDYEEPGRLVPTILMGCVNDMDFELAQPEPVRDFIYVEDICDLYLKAAFAKNINGDIFNAGSGVQHSVGEVVKTCMDISATNAKPIWGAREGRPFDTQVWVANVEKAYDCLGWRAKYDLKSGLEKTFQWFTANLERFGKRYEKGSM